MDQDATVCGKIPRHSRPSGRITRVKGHQMRKLIVFVMLTLAFITVVSYAIAQTHKRKHQSNATANRNANSNTRSVVEREQLDAVKSTNTKPKAAIGAGGAGTYARKTSGGHWVTRNGKRIWVPQGSPAKNANTNR